MLGSYGTATEVITLPEPDLPAGRRWGYNFDLAEANRLLDEAGYKDTDGDKVGEMPDGNRPLRFRLFAGQKVNTSQQSIQFMQGWLRSIGIATEVKVLEENRLTEIIGQGEFDLFEVGLGGRARPRLPALDLHLRLAELQVRAATSW